MAKMTSLDWVASSVVSWSTYCHAVFALCPSCFHSKKSSASTNRQLERTNLESELRCTSTCRPGACISQVEYAHNLHSLSTTGMLLFMVAYGFQPPVFPSQEQEVPLVKAHLRRCHHVWRHAGAALELAAGRFQLQTGGRSNVTCLGRCFYF